jgi:hypothetical protein
MHDTARSSRRVGSRSRDVAAGDSALAATFTQRHVATWAPTCTEKNIIGQTPCRLGHGLRAPTTRGGTPIADQYEVAGCKLAGCMKEGTREQGASPEERESYLQGLKRSHCWERLGAMQGGDHGFPGTHLPASGTWRWRSATADVSDHNSPNHLHNGNLLHWRRFYRDWASLA